MKKLLAVLLTGCMALSMAACGSSAADSKAPDSSEAPASSEAEVSAESEAEAEDETLSGDISFMVLDSFNKDTNPLQDATDAFMEANPGVNVTIEYVSANDIREKFSTAARGGAGPDVVALDSAGWAVDSAASGLLAPLDEQVAGIADQFYSAPLASGS